MDIPYSERIRGMVVIGTRPEAIKMIPVIRALNNTRKFRPVVVSTGQHNDMVNELFRDAGLKIDVNLRVADHTDGTPPTLNQMFSRVISGIDRIWQHQGIPTDYRGDGRRGVHGSVACLVHGDTSSAAAAAIAAFNLQIPVVHVEAGLRTSNLLSPFPEEGNRQIISRIAAVHLAPTKANKINLVREGVDYDRIVVTGNTSIDMLHWAIEQQSDYGPGLESLDPENPPRFVLVTAHRRENWATGLKKIAEAVRELSERYEEIKFVVPMHPNPGARQPQIEVLSDRPNVLLVEPRGYKAFAKLMSDAYLIITDSGGVQEEAPALNVPVLVTRSTTERQEGVDAGTLLLVGTETSRIVSEASRLLDDEVEHARVALRPNPYGDGRASERIVEALDHIMRGTPISEVYGGNALGQAVRRHLGIK